MYIQFNVSKLLLFAPLNKSSNQNVFSFGCNSATTQTNINNLPQNFTPTAMPALGIGTEILWRFPAPEIGVDSPGNAMIAFSH
jgi:hypothetical protein